MIRFEAEETIARPAGEVWAYAADARRHPDWMGVIDARLVGDDSTIVGARVREHVQLGPARRDQEILVTASVPGETIAWRMVEGGPFVGEVTLDLETIGPGATRARYSGSLGLTGWRRILEPFLTREVRAGEAAELRRLKANLEPGS